MSQMRQSDVRESETPISGNTPREHGGHEGEGSPQERPLLHDPLQAGASVDEGKHLSKPEGSSNVSPLPSQPKEKKATTRSPVAARTTGVLIGASLEEQFRLAKYYSASGLMPKGLDTPEKVLVGLQLCHELGLAPMTSIGKICVINGTPSMFGDLPLSLVMKSGLLVSIKEEILMDGEKVIGARCTVQRKNFEPTIREFTETDAKKAGLLGKGVWKSYDKRMYQFRARSWALKDIFPDILNGVAIAEWDFNQNPDLAPIVEVKEETEVTDDLNSRYADTPEDAPKPEDPRKAKAIEVMNYCTEKKIPMAQLEQHAQMFCGKALNDLTVEDMTALLTDMKKEVEQ